MDTFAFVEQAVPQPFFNTSGRTSAPVELIKKDLAAPATAFTISANGMVSEGFYLEFDHPVSNGKIAMILGEGQSYVMRDAVNNRGCIYQPKNGRAFTRRAAVGEMQTQNGAKFPLLRKPEEGDTNRLAYVQFGLLPGAKMREGFEPLYAGVGGNARCVAWGGDEALVEMEKNDSLVIFYTTGQVARIHYDGLANMSAHGYSVHMLQLDDALDERIDRVRETIAKSESKEHDAAAARTEDRALHELASMLRMAKAFPEYQAKLIHTVEKIAVDHPLRPGVATHFREALAFIGDSTIYGWLAGTDAIEEVVSVPAKTFVESPKKYDGRLHGLISDAMASGSSWQWELAATQLIKASEEGQLRPGVHKRFILQCPAEFVVILASVSELRVVVATEQQSFGTSPLRNGREEKEKPSANMLKAKQRAKQLERAAAQPKKGAGGQKQQQHGPGKHQKRGGHK